MLERRTLLNEVVADEPKTAVLREDGGFVMDGAVLEVEHHLGGHAIATDDLNDIAVSECVALQRAQYQEAVERSLRVANGHRLRRRYCWLDKCGAGDQNRERGGKETFCCPINHAEDSRRCAVTEIVLHKANSQLTKPGDSAF